MRNRWIVGIVAMAAVAAFAFWWSQSNKAGQVSSEPAVASPADSEATPGNEPAAVRPRVDVIRPRVGSVTRFDSEPGTVRAFYYENIVAKVPGYLDKQYVDIGDRVKVGQLLAQLYAPELVQAVDQAKAELGQADAQVALAQAAIGRAQADLDAAKATVVEKEAQLKRATAYLKFRQIQYDRIKDLYQQKAIDERLVDEHRSDRDAAAAAEDAGKAAIITARAECKAKEAKIVEANADLANAKAKVEVANAALEKAKVFVKYLEIRSKYNGVVTKRNFHEGEFIRPADQGGGTPMLVVAETDKMRVEMQMPEAYVPYTDPGDPALVELDALSGKQFHGTVARIANSLDPVTRTMRVEVDLKNPPTREHQSGELRDGMFGRVTVYLSRSTKELSIPSTSLVGNIQGKTNSVYIVRDGRLQVTPIKIGHEDGVRAEVLGGLQPGDLVVQQPTGDLYPGEAVEPIVLPSDQAAAAKGERGVADRQKSGNSPNSE